MKGLLTSCIVALAALLAPLAPAQSLQGSHASLNRQSNQARVHGLSYMEDAPRVKRFVAAGLLVKLEGNADYDLSDVSYPFARPAVKLFIERVSSQFHAACGEKLTITSMTRPEDEQPPNSSEQSVHPTGIAVDLRVPRSNSCLRWLERVLLSLEGARVLEATREHNPPHYHVAVFPDPYQNYVASLESEDPAGPQYVVRKGDSLTTIARATGTTVNDLRAENGLDGDLIRVGQSLDIP